MSLEAIKKAAAAAGDTYVSVRADDLAKALKDAGESPTRGSLAEHVGQVCDKAERLAKAEGVDPVYPMISAHREKHLGKLLGAAGE